MRTINKRLVDAVAICVWAGLHVADAAAQEPVVRGVVVVGNNWDGTADVFDPQAFKVLKRINIVPDRGERLKEIASVPVGDHPQRVRTGKMRLGEGAASVL